MPDAWRWWEGRRLGYNLALALAGITAFALWVAIVTWSGLMPVTLPGALTLALGYGLFMGGANVCFLLGPLAERILEPLDRAAYRRRAWTMGLWGSCALPFLFPIVTALALLAG